MLTDASARAEPRAITRSMTIDACRSTVGQAVDASGLEETQVLGLVPDAPSDEQDALRALLRGEQPTGRRATARAIARLEDVLGVDLGAEALRGRFNWFGRGLADFVGLIAGPFCGYLIVAGLIEGDSLLLGNSIGPFGLVLFLGLLAVLGLYEALHTSATQLKLADLGGIAGRYPRAARLHRRFRTDEGLSRFLAGRQMVVIVTVFFCSPLASFPHLQHWPLTTIELPGLVRALVTVGMPGALFVYWFGQLVPQFLATRHAVKLTNAAVVELAFKGAFALEALGLARPGKWLAALDRRRSEPIPSSGSLRWEQSARELDGFGVVGVVRDWTVGDGGSELRATTNVRIYQREPTLTDGSMLVPGAPCELLLRADAQRGAETLSLQPTEHREEILASGDRRFHKPVLPVVGSFLAGDEIRVSMSASYAGMIGRDLVVVDRPARFVLFRVRTEFLPESVPAAVLRSYRVGDGLADLALTGEVLIEPTVTEAGELTISALVAFPPSDTLHVLDWEVIV